MLNFYFMFEFFPSPVYFSQIYNPFTRHYARKCRWVSSKEWFQALSLKNSMFCASTFFPDLATPLRSIPIYTIPHANILRGLFCFQEIPSSLDRDSRLVPTSAVAWRHWMTSQPRTPLSTSRRGYPTLGRRPVCDAPDTSPWSRRTTWATMTRTSIRGRHPPRLLPRSRSRSRPRQPRWTIQPRWSPPPQPNLASGPSPTSPLPPPIDLVNRIQEGFPRNSNHGPAMPSSSPKQLPTLPQPRQGARRRRRWAPMNLRRCRGATRPSGHRREAGCCRWPAAATVAILRRDAETIHTVYTITWSNDRDGWSRSRDWTSVMAAGTIKLKYPAGQKIVNNDESCIIY